MRYSFVLSALAAGAIATPFVNVEVAENGEINNGHPMNSGPNMFSRLFSSNYECIIEGRDGDHEQRVDRDCCREVGGRLSDLKGHCIVRDMMHNPRNDWRDCALGSRGIAFADCYWREQREIDHDLDRERDPHQGHGRNDRDNDRDDRNRDRDDRRGKHQHVLMRDNNEYECGIDMDDDRMERDIVRECCNEETDDGRLVRDDRACLVDSRRDRHDFEDCARRQGAQDTFCRRNNNNNNDDRGRY